MAAKTEHQFSVALADLEQDEQHLNLSIPAGWLASVLNGTEARSCGADGELDLVVSMSGRDVLVRGQLRARVEMACSRSLEPFELPIETDVFLMLAPAAAESSPRRRPARAGSKLRSAGGPQAGGGKSAGSSNSTDAVKPVKAKKSKHESDEEEALSDEDAARDVYSGDEVVLDSFIREFILLELPLFPLRSEDTPHIAPPSQEPAAGDRPLDPRLAPLAALRDRLRKKE